MADAQEFTSDAPEVETDPKKNPVQGLDQIIPDVQIEEANTPYEPKTTVLEAQSGRFIQYDGIATARIMDASAWADAHVESNNYFEWNYLNQKRIPLEAFTDDELRYLLRIDGQFSIVEVEAETTE